MTMLISKPTGQGGIESQLSSESRSLGWNMTARSTVPLCSMRITLWGNKAGDWTVMPCRARLIWGAVS